MLILNHIVSIFPSVFVCFLIIVAFTPLHSDQTRIMFLSRYFGRTLLAAAKSETSAAAAAATSSVRTGYNPLEEFFELDRSKDDDKPVVYGTLLF